VEEAGRQSVVGGKPVFHAWKRSVVSGKWVVRGWRGAWVECANFLRQCSGSKECGDFVEGSGRGRKAVRSWWKTGFPCLKRYVVSDKWVVCEWRGVWVKCANFLRQCSGSKESTDLVAGSGRVRKVVWHSNGCSFPCFGQFYVLKRFSMSGNRWNGYALWLRTLLFLQVVREIDKNWVQYVINAPMCSLPHAYMLFSPWKSFRPTLYFSPEVISIFSNYRAPLVIITTNQLVANFVKVHQYFTRTIKLVTVCRKVV